jgi:hypothetical protein
MLPLFPGHLVTLEELLLPSLEVAQLQLFEHLFPGNLRAEAILESEQVHRFQASSTNAAASSAALGTVMKSNLAGGGVGQTTQGVIGSIKSYWHPPMTAFNPVHSVYAFMGPRLIWVLALMVMLQLGPLHLRRSQSLLSQSIPKEN